MLQHYRHTTIWHSTIAGTHHQTFHVAKKYLFKWQGWKGSHNIEPEDSQGLQKVDTNSILTSMVADFHWSVQWSAHQQIHFRHKEEQLLMYHNLLVGSLEAGSCVFNLINWLQVRVMITSVKFQKKRLLLFPLERIPPELFTSLSIITNSHPKAIMFQESIAHIHNLGLLRTKNPLSS